MILGGIMNLSVVSKYIFTNVMLVGAFSTFLSFLSSLVSLFIVNLLARLVTKVSKIDEVLSKHEDQGKELKRIKYLAVTKICVLISFAVIRMSLAFDSWGRVIGYFQEILLWISNLVSIIILAQLLGFMSYVHHRLAMLNMMIASVFKKEMRGVLPRDPRKCTLRSSFECTHCVQMYLRAKQSYTSSQINNISVLNSNCCEISPCGVSVLLHYSFLDIIYVREL
jgi:hypothetical protein